MGNDVLSEKGIYMDNVVIENLFKTLFESKLNY